MSEESIDTVVNEYYKLKTKYEDDNNAIKRKIMKNSALSWKEKRNEFHKVKPKCINCKRPGGTIFSSKYHEESGGEYNEFRQLKAICGVIMDPCNLNITINVGKYNFMSDILTEYDTEIREIKNNIINYKNKLLFGFITTNEALNSFTNLKKLLNDYTTYYHSFMEEYFHIADNSEDQRALKENIEQSYVFVENIKKSIQDFNETNNVQFVRDVVNIYEQSLNPLFKKMMNLKYREKFVWYNDETNTYHLIQKKNSIKDLEFNEGDQAVVSFVFGVGNVRAPVVTNAKNVTQKQTENVDENQQPNTDLPEIQKAKRNSKKELQKAKKKLKIVGEIQSGGREEEMYEPFLEEYDIEPNGNITWKQEEYQQIWDNLQPTLQSDLMKDKEWLQLFMQTCAVKNNDQVCSFVPPPNLILPPQILEDGKYDFGNEVYNTYFNSLDKTEQNHLLDLYIIKDGVKKYDTLEEKLAENISIQFGLTV